MFLKLSLCSVGEWPPFLKRTNSSFLKMRTRMINWDSKGHCACPFGGHRGGLSEGHCGPFGGHRGGLSECHCMRLLGGLGRLTIKDFAQLFSYLGKFKIYSYISFRLGQCNIFAEYA